MRTSLYRHLARLGLIALAAAAGCIDRGITKVATGGESISGVTTSSSSGGSDSSGTTSSTGGIGTSAGTGGNTTTSGGGSISGTTGAPRRTYWDGGYVSCSYGSSFDAGPSDWTCTPGTYFCDLALDHFGNCFQCRSDADCADPALPTYDPRRPRCDLDSGIAGYQNACQVCLVDADCNGSDAGPYCDAVDDMLTGETLLAPFEDFGFEACGSVPIDCRLDGGPVCHYLNQFCDGTSGRCAWRGACATDKDCVGVFSDNYLLLAPVCVGGQCAVCDRGSGCPGQPCSSDAECGGLAPVCINSYCSCEHTDQCGDGGLLCLPDLFGGVAACGVPCSDPRAPSCGALGSDVGLPVCDPVTGMCGACVTDQQCREGSDTGGPLCLKGWCGCTKDGDCASGQACQPEFGVTHEFCVRRTERCTVGSCGTWCDWQTGECAGDSRACHDDYDCSHSFYGDDFCDPLQGVCVSCRNNADCEHLDGGHTAGNACVVSSSGSGGSCGCISDQDCVGITAGGRCNLDANSETFGTCGCSTPTDCQTGLACHNSGGGPKCVAAQCAADAECQAGFFCAPDLSCRPRCDPGHSCQAVEPLCDDQNVVGWNSAGETWCYACRRGSDCPEGEGCDSYTNTCGVCRSSYDCRSGEVCAGGVCHSGCTTGVCPQTELCDTENLAGYGNDFCYQCLSAADCPGDEGCNSLTHLCGSCREPHANSASLSGVGAASDCPPDDICSAFWSEAGLIAGVCLPNCDRSSCPAAQPICAVLPALTPDHHYCFGCLSDADCADAGPGAWCDVSVGMTFQCQLPP